MNVDAIRHFYDYHFAQNRETWDNYIAPLTDEQFTQPQGYSRGSVRDHCVHLMNVDEAWFSGLRGFEGPAWLEPAAYGDRSAIRARWDAVEQMMREYLAALTDEQLAGRPFPEGEDENLIAWQVLLHVVNHGTDHRAQMLRVLNDMGAKTVSQDYIFYVYDNP